MNSSLENWVEPLLIHAELAVPSGLDIKSSVILRDPPYKVCVPIPFRQLSSSSLPLPLQQAWQGKSRPSQRSSQRPQTTRDNLEHWYSARQINSAFQLGYELSYGKAQAMATDSQSIWGGAEDAAICLMASSRSQRSLSQVWPCRTMTTGVCFGGRAKSQDRVAISSSLASTSSSSNSTRRR